jgi:hypothetical protein
MTMENELIKSGWGHYPLGGIDGLRVLRNENDGTVAALGQGICVFADSFDELKRRVVLAKFALHGIGD